MALLSSQLPLISQGAFFYKVVVCSNNSVLQSKQGKGFRDSSVYWSRFASYEHNNIVNRALPTVCLNRGLGGAISTPMVFY